MTRIAPWFAAVACLLWSGLAPAAEAQDESVSPTERALARYYDDLQQELLRSTRPRDWVHAAFLPTHASATERGLRDRALREAAAAAPDDVYVQWIRAGTLDATEGQCSTGALHPDRVDALLRLDPDNAAAWMVRLTQAEDEHDALGIDAALARVAAAPRFDAYLQTAIDDWMTIFAQRPLPDVTDATDPLPRDADARAYVMASAMALSMSITEAPLPFKALMQACRNAAAGTATTRRGSCIEIGRHLLHRPGTLLQQRFGAAVLRGLDALDDADRESLRQLDWQERAFERAPPRREADMVAFARERITAVDDESAVIRRALRRAGLSDTAPDGWEADAPTPQLPEARSEVD